MTQEQARKEVSRLFNEEGHSAYHISLHTGLSIKHIYSIIEQCEIATNNHKKAIYESRINSNAN